MLLRAAWALPALKLTPRLSIATVRVAEQDPTSTVLAGRLGLKDG
jgi:hypothetical protein